VKFKVGDKVIYYKKDENAFREDKLEVGSIFTLTHFFHKKDTLNRKYDLYFCTIDGNSVAFYEHQLLPLNDMTKLLYPEAKEIA
jgi:hypothetical protein